jgi:hypothetical protein
MLESIVSELKGYKDYKYIVKDPDYMGGKRALRGTRLSVSHILGCMAEGMDHQEIEVILEVLAVAAEVTESPDVAA